MTSFDQELIELIINNNQSSNQNEIIGHKVCGDQCFKPKKNVKF